MIYKNNMKTKQYIPNCTVESVFTHSTCHISLNWDTLLY